MNVEKSIRHYLNKGVHKDHDPEKNQQIVVANLFSFIGYSITFIMGISAFFRGDKILGTVLFSASLLFLSSRLILSSTKLSNPYRCSASLVTVSLMLLMVYLVWSGGVHGTGPLWIYVVPPVALFFGGMRKGSRNLALFILLISVILFYPNDKLLAFTYNFEFKTRLLYSFLTVSLLFAFYEYWRQKSYRLSQRISRKFERQARKDPLSKILNRRGMLEKLEEEFARCRRYHSYFTVMMCDIDHFKKVNDRFGHQTGDDVIAQIAHSFKQSMRQQDTVSRWGGEEYLFLLPETNSEQAYILAEKLREKIAAQRFHFENTTFQVNISFGLYELTPEDSINQAISKADQRLYLAKKLGRNRTIASDEDTI